MFCGRMYDVNMRFKNRAEAGDMLAERLAAYKGKQTVVYALPRGGVPVAAPIARALHAPLELVVTRKIGHPEDPEYALGAVAPDGHTIFNEENKANVDSAWLAREIERERREAERRRVAYTRAPFASPAEKIAIVVDDGIATGLTMLLAIRELRHHNPRELVVAVPVLPPDILPVLEREADNVIAAHVPSFYAGAVGAYYENFEQVSDAEVKRLLKAHASS